MAGKLDEMERKALERTATISHRIREAIRAALPAPPEQFFTVMVPGKVINFADYMDGFDENGKPTAPTLPTVTELNQAILCDDMPALASVQLGPTGKSVSRSYGATLSKLVPNGTTVGVEVADPDALTDAEKRYNRAMEWLLAEDERNPGKSHLDSYISKQRLYTEAEARRNNRLNDALRQATTDPLNKTVSQQRAAYDKWVSANARSLRNDVEGAYKDWVIHGRKEQVEYWFAVVDNDSAMSRVEQSKEAMRNHTVLDIDGSVAYPKVRLNPSNWAWIAYQKMKGKTDQTRTVAQCTWEIARLTKKNRMIEVLIENPPQLKGADGNAPKVPETNEADNKVKEASKKYVEKTTALDNLRRNPKANPADVTKASKEATEAKAELDKTYAEYDKSNLARLEAMNLVAMENLLNKSKADLQNEIKANEETIADLEKERQALIDAQSGDPAEGMVNDVLGPSKGAPADPNTPDLTDYFTPISVQISASSESSSASKHSLSVGASASTRFGLFGWFGGVSGGGSHSSSSSDAQSEMSKSDVKVSFECMRVDIERSWLRPELFYDEDLRAAPGANISPGHVRLAALMDPDNSALGKSISDTDREQELQRYSTFPIYPTAFLLACNVVLEISGETAAIQSHFDTSTSTASASVGWGPFRTTTTTTKSDEHSSASCETTSSGCRITIKAPQIIGWVSEMVPALPRPDAGPEPSNPNAGSVASVASVGEDETPGASGSPKAAPQSSGSGTKPTAAH